MLLLLLASMCAQAPAAGNALPELREQWEGLYLGALKAGHTRTVYDQIEVGGRAAIKTTSTMEMKLPRFGDTAAMGMDAVFYETLGGKLYGFDSTLRQPGQDQVTIGRLDAAGKMALTLTTAGKETVQPLDWPADVLGAAAQDRLLRKFAAGTDAEAKFVAFLPGVNQIADTTVKRVGRRKTKVAGGAERELLQVLMEQTARPNGQKLPASTVWLDDRGRTLKTEISMFGTMTSYAMAKDAALAAGNPADAATAAAASDVGFSTLVPCPRIAGARTAAAVEYALEMADADAAKALQDSGAQRVTKRDGLKLLVRVERRTPPPGAAPGPAAAEYLQANGFVQSDHAEIVAVAKQAVGAEADPWKKCQKLERWVKTEMKHGDFSVAFQTALDALRERRGDCTEHGVLLAALCRAAGVPARVAVGLVYVDYPAQPKLGYHLWTEVNFGGAWYALDGTLGDGAVGGDRLKLADSSLKGASALGCFLPVFDVMGKLKIVSAAPSP